MCSNFQFAAGESGLVIPDIAADEAYLNGWYAGVNFASVFRSTPFIGGVADYHTFSPAPVDNVAHVPYGNFSPEIVTPEVKLPKQEALNYTGVFELQKFNHNGKTDAGDGEIYHSVNFYSTFEKSSLYETNDFRAVLPLLESFEQQQFYRSQPQSPVTMFSPISLPSSSSAIKSHLNRVKSTRSLTKRPPPYQRSSASAKQCNRRRLSDNTRSLQKLLPGDKKMDTSTLLEEAFKYIKFLQAQVIALQLMPLHAVAVDDTTKVNTGYSEAVYGNLGKMNRQQLLQLVLNSPVAQAVLYSRGCCIYSVEQLNLLSEVAERKAFFEH